MKENFNVKEYQNLILQEIISSQKYNLTHTFNFNNTKKRFIMMTTQKSKLTVYKKILSIPVLIIAFSIFVQKVYAHDTLPKTDESNNKQIQDHAISSKDSKGIEIQKNGQSEILLDSKTENQKVTTSPQTGNINDEEILDTKTENNEATPIEIQNVTEPEYPGGNQQLRIKMANVFDASKINSLSKETYKSVISFVVDATGKATEVRADGNNEAFNNEAKLSFLKANEGVTWKPATKDGKAVASHMTVPLTMSFN